MDSKILYLAKYFDLVAYLPINFASIWLIENYGLKHCISIGSIIMIFGSIIRFSQLFGSIYYWYFGHIICACS
jgi:hypothetical protein